jgi:hypothetical protein
MNNIRLSYYDVDIIKQAFRHHFMDNDELWIFGSRVDTSKKGGDIDLYIETHYPNPEQVVDAKINFLVEVQGKIGERKIDVVIKLDDDFDLPIYHVAKNEGIRLQ